MTPEIQRAFTALTSAVEKNFRDTVLKALPNSRTFMFVRPKSAPAKSAAITAPHKARRPVSAAGKAKQKLQGRYLGALRGLGAAARARVKKLRAVKGTAAAIYLAKSLQK